MRSYVTGMTEELKGECFSLKLHDNMEHSRLIFHAQKVEYSRLGKKNKEAKKERSSESSSTKSRLDVKYKSKFKKRF